MWGLGITTAITKRQSTSLKAIRVSNTMVVAADKQVIQGIEVGHTEDMAGELVVDRQVV